MEKEVHNLERKLGGIENMFMRRQLLAGVAIGDSIHGFKDARGQWSYLTTRPSMSCFEMLRPQRLNTVGKTSTERIHCSAIG